MNPCSCQSPGKKHPSPRHRADSNSLTCIFYELEPDAEANVLPLARSTIEKEHFLPPPTRKDTFEPESRTNGDSITPVCASDTPFGVSRVDRNQRPSFVYGRPLLCSAARELTGHLKRPSTMRHPIRSPVSKPYSIFPPRQPRKKTPTGKLQENNWLSWSTIISQWRTQKKKTAPSAPKTTVI